MPVTRQHIVHVVAIDGSRGDAAFRGAENHLWVLLPQLVLHGYAVSLIVLQLGVLVHKSYENRLDQLRERGVEVIEIQPWRFTINSRKLKHLQLWTGVFLEARKRRTATFHAHLEITYLPLVLRLATGKRVVFSLHNDSPSLESSVLGARRFLLKYTIQHYIAISDRVAQYFRSCMRLHSISMSTIYYGLALPDLVDSAHQSSRDSRKRIVFGFVGRLVEQKNLFALVNAFSKTPAVDLQIIGSGPQEDDLKRLVADNKAGNVVFLGSVENASRLMHTFDVLVLPSLWEGLGLVLIEAMLQGVPILGSNRGAIPDILGNGIYGQICEPDVESIRAALEDCQENYEKWQVRARRAVLYARDRFSIRRMTEETAQVYASLTS
jgi:glycosyltransferase involved in cell wall biosynthesis